MAKTKDPRYLRCPICMKNNLTHKEWDEHLTRHAKSEINNENGKFTVESSGQIKAVLDEN